MARKRHPRTIEELEYDDEVYGPAERREEQRLLVELNQRSLWLAAEHIERSRALLARATAKLPGRRGARQPNR